jgi:NAD(P)-dependent dehydrogenase (short-subunit alcohol dehydrogenase family)
VAATARFWQGGVLHVYAASKAALRSLTRTLAAELFGRRIRVNAVALGPIWTPAYEKATGSAEAAKNLADGCASQVPMKRLGSPEEIARAVLFLASDDAANLEGTDLANLFAFRDEMWHPQRDAADSRGWASPMLLNKELP